MIIKNAIKRILFILCFFYFSVFSYGEEREKKQKFLEEKTAQVERVLKEKLGDSYEIKFRGNRDAVYIYELEENFEGEKRFLLKLIEILRHIDIVSDKNGIEIEIIKIRIPAGEDGRARYISKAEWKFGNNSYYNEGEKINYSYLQGDGIYKIVKFYGENKIIFSERDYDEIWSLSENEKKIIRVVQNRYKDGDTKVLKVVGEKNGQQLYNYNYNREGEYDGQQLEYYSNGNLKTKAAYSNGLPHGIQETFYEDGSLKTKTEYNKGWLSGRKNVYSPEGEIISEIEYTYNSKKGIQTASLDLKYVKQFKKGKIFKYEVTLSDKVIRRSYLDGKMSGKQIVRNLKEELLSTTEYKNGVRHGLDKRYYPDGKVKSVTKYFMGKPVGSSYEYTPEGKKIKIGAHISEIIVLNGTAKKILFVSVYIKRYLFFLIVIFILIYIKQAARKRMLVKSL